MLVFCSANGQVAPEGWPVVEIANPQIPDCNGSLQSRDAFPSSQTVKRKTARQLLSTEEATTSVPEELDGSGVHTEEKDKRVEQEGSTVDHKFFRALLGWTRQDYLKKRTCATESQDLPTTDQIVVVSEDRNSLTDNGGKVGVAQPNYSTVHPMQDPQKISSTDYKKVLNTTTEQEGIDDFRGLDFSVLADCPFAPFFPFNKENEQATGMTTIGD